MIEVVFIPETRPSTLMLMVGRLLADREWSGCE
jgi:hypothetical protein